MPLAATLRCACEMRHLEPAFSYDAPPAGETAFAIGAAAYRRRYDRCTICGHWFGRHDIDLSKLYERDYVTATYGDAAGMRQRFEKIMALPAERSDNRQRVVRVVEFAKSRLADAKATPRLLDVGAGLGVFPAGMKAAGWRVTALEPDPRTADHLRRVVGVDTSTDDLAALAAGAPFDAITFNKVLEHIEDPVRMLGEARRHLGSNGFIYVEVPDVEAASAGPGREEFFIEHHHVFSPASLTFLVEHAGYTAVRVERCVEPSGKYTLFAFCSPSSNNR